MDNVVDMAHFFYVHYAFPTYSQVTEEMRARFEFEIDTELANACWRSEVDENTRIGRVVHA